MCGVRGNGTYRLRRLADGKIRVENFLVGNIKVIDGIGKPIRKFSDLHAGMLIELHVTGDHFPIKEVVESVGETAACLRQLA